MTQFYFLHIGGINDIVQMFIQSIRITNPNSKIIQITDTRSEKISFVDNCIRYEGDVSNLMKFRTEAFSKIKFDDNSANIFLDSDMLIIKKINTEILFNDFQSVLCQRFYDVDEPVNFNYMNLKMFENINKKLGDVWPILGCFIALKNENVFQEVNDIYDQLEKKYYKWYGDQIALKIFYDKNKKNIKLVNEKIFANAYPDENYVESYILHFKGNKKKSMKDYFNNIFKKDV